jgi:peptidoglycan/LPS O-acetylase OafA/YrhL
MFVSALFALTILRLHRIDTLLATSKILRPVALCGTISYSLYLVHVPVGHVVHLAARCLGCGDTIGAVWIETLVCLLASLAAAWLLYVSVERRFLNTPRKVRQQASDEPCGNTSISTRTPRQAQAA